eukprot:2752251-Pyramimonas_sp.AAC.1
MVPSHPPCGPFRCPPFASAGTRAGGTESVAKVAPHAGTRRAADVGDELHPPIHPAPDGAMGVPRAPQYIGVSCVTTDSSPGRQTVRGTHGALLPGNLEFAVVVHWRSGRTAVIPRLLYISSYTAFSVSKHRGPLGALPGTPGYTRATRRTGYNRRAHPAFYRVPRGSEAAIAPRKPLVVCKDSLNVPNLARPPAIRGPL